MISANNNSPDKPGYKYADFKSNLIFMMKENKIFDLLMARLLKNFFILITSLAFLLITCDTQDDFPKYYEGKLTDSITIISQSDTTNIMIEQLRLLPVFRDSVPYSEEITIPDSGTIRLKLIVSFGSYSERPGIVKQVNQIDDTVFVWYSNRDRISKQLLKDNTITVVNTSPRIEYVSIDSVFIQRNQNEKVNLYSRLLN